MFIGFTFETKQSTKHVLLRQNQEMYFRAIAHYFRDEDLGGAGDEKTQGRSLNLNLDFEVSSMTSSLSDVWVSGRRELSLGPSRPALGGESLALYQSV